MKRFGIGITLLGVVVISLYVLQEYRNGEAADMKTASTFVVSRGPIRSAVATTGRVIANLDVEIKCKASGKITQLPFNVSDQVKKGDLLVELDPVDEQRFVNQAQATLEASKTQLEQARKNHEIAALNLQAEKKRAEANVRSLKARLADVAGKAKRARQSLETGILSPQECESAEALLAQTQAELDTARTRYDDLESAKVTLDVREQDIALAQSRVQLDQSRLDDALQRLEDTKVYSPINGVVTARNAQVGQIISSGISNIGGGTTMLTLADLSKIFVVASVHESDIGRVQVEQSATVTADAFPNQTFTGSVVRIGTKGINQFNVVTFEVHVEITDASKYLLRPEMTTNVDILLAEESDALLIPAEALARRENKQVVRVVGNDGETQERAVEVGITDGISYQVLAGLAQGDVVVANSDLAQSKWSAESQRTGRPLPSI